MSQYKDARRMSDNQSLSSFYDRVDNTTLDNCDREEIHLSAAIQPIGASLVIDAASNLVVAASDNVRDFLDTNQGTLLGCALADINEDLSQLIAPLESTSTVTYEVLDYELQHAGTSFDVVTHEHAGRRFIEFVPNNSPSAVAVRKAMRRYTTACARILNADSFEAAMQITADAARDITGFGRVKIYRFLPDWSGKVVAESRVQSMSSYLGLHFPERDIPRQVRRVMEIIPCRAIGTSEDTLIAIRRLSTDDTPLDLSWSVLRSVSSMHTTYLRNMGVSASFSSSLMYKGELWGLIAAHHDEAQYVPFDSWGLVQELATTLMLRFDQQERTEISEMIRQLHLLENEFASSLRLSGDVEDVISKLVPVLQNFLGADGFAFQYGSSLHVSGATPPKPFIRDLIKWAIKQRQSSDQYQTSQLHKDWEPAREHMNTACGVLIQPIVVHRVCQLLWFRGPLTKNVEWAGKPAVKTENDSTDTLQPRSSFERWTQEHHDQSAAWRKSEIESAKEIFTEFMDIIASQLLLKRENDSLREFATTAAHDIRTPLRHIYSALDIMHEENFDKNVVKQTHAMARNSAKRLETLTNGLLQLSVIKGQITHQNSIDLNVLLKDVVEMVQTDLSRENGTIQVEALPTIMADESLLTRLFLNLISNAIKYRNPDRLPKILVTIVESSPKSICIGVGDNGLGIDPKYAEKIFEPLVRLETKDNIEGSGLGLAICQRVAEAHNGSIQLDTTYNQGTRFLITLPSGVAQT